MNKIYKVKICSLLLMLFVSGSVFSANAANKINNVDNLNISEKNAYSKNNVVSIKLNDVLPEDLKDQRLAAFKILKPVLSKKILTASVLWQNDETSFGKKASISSVYISDYLNNKISTEKFIEHINLQLVEPIPLQKNLIEPANINEVSMKNMLLASKLREKADLYRLYGNEEAALRIYLQIVELNPNDYISLFRVGDIYKKQLNEDLAKVYFSKALSINPDFRCADDALFELNKKVKN